VLFGKWEDEMKTSLLFLTAVVSIASLAAVNAAPHKPVAPVKDDPVNINRCNVNLWPGFSATPCRPPPGVTTYGECQSLVLKAGWTSSETRWYCSSVHFKN
jgi:hypothetical protein